MVRRVLPGNKSNTSFVGGSNLTLFSYSKNKEGALAYINYLSDKDSQLKWFQISNSLPSRKDAWQAKELTSAPILSVFGEQLKAAKPAPSITQWEAISQVLQKAMETMAVNGNGVQKTMDDINERAKEILAQ